jgi:hypothetical protein
LIISALVVVAGRGKMELMVVAEVLLGQQGEVFPAVVVE